MEEALLAIIALTNGEFDNEYLMGFGPLPEDFREAVKLIAANGIRGEALIAECQALQHKELGVCRAHKRREVETLE
jgi:hypothetical protein